MKFICSKQDFLEAVSSCLRAVSQRTTVTVLEGILIEAERELVLTGYDTNIGIKVQCPADVSQPGRLVINARLINEVIRKMPEDYLTFERQSEGMIKLSGGNSAFMLKVMAADEFPRLPDVEINEAEALVVRQALLKEMINKTVFSVSTDVARPVLNGALLSATQEQLSMVAIDGFRMAVMKRSRAEEEGEGEEKEQRPDWKDAKIIIHGKTLRELVSLLRDKGDVRIYISQNHVLFDLGKVCLLSVLIKGDFMDYTKILPKSSSSVMQVETRQLLDAFDRALLMVLSDDKRFPVSVQSKDEETLRLSIDTARGSFDEQLEIKLEGEAIDCKFNPRMMMDALRVIDDERIKLKFTGSVGPCVIEPEEGTAFSYLILPLRNF